MKPSSVELREIYEQTVVVRAPRYGIVSGYHELPYVCIGESFKSGHNTTVVRGKVQVSPQFVIRPQHYNPSYEDLFGEDTDSALVGRIFGFLGFAERPVECKSEFLELKHVDAGIDRVLSETQDELERKEDIATGVVVTPNAQYFPVSVERFIASVLDEEFRS
jgi:hypothetical protein